MKTYFFLLILLTAINLNADTATKGHTTAYENPFSIIFGGEGTILYGDFVSIASSVQCIQKDDGSCDHDYQGYLYDATTKFINSVSTNIIPLNSSTQTLTLPNDINGSDILFAGLYWQGHIAGTDSNDYSTGIQGREKVNLIDAKGNSYNLNADKLWYHDFWGNGTGTDGGYRSFYQGYKDITSIIQNSYRQDQTNNYTVGNIKSTVGSDSYQYFWTVDAEANSIKMGFWGNWNLIVVYKHPDISIFNPLPKPKNITIFHGFDALIPIPTSSTETQTKTIDVSLNGFLTSNTSPIEAKLLFYGSGGEKKLNYDKLEIQDKKTTDFNSIYNTLNPIDDAFNGTVSILDTEQNSSIAYYPGLDSDVFDVSSSMDTKQTSTEIKLTARFEDYSGDQFFPGLIAFSTDVYVPKFCYDYAYQQQDVYFTEKNDGTKLPRIVGTVLSGEPVKVKVYIRNQVESDINVTDMFVSVLDINTTQATYIPETTELATNGATIATPIPDSSLETSDAYIKDIPIGTVSANEFFYIYYQLDPLRSDLNISLNLQADYMLSLDGADPIPYSLVLGENMQICSSSDFKYLPAKGIFNIVHNNYYDLDIGGTNQFYNLPTQVSSRVGNFKVLSMDPDHLDELNPISTIVAVDMIDASAFHDTNAACGELSSAISQRVWVMFDDNVTSTQFNSAVVNSDFYKNARQNAAFRVSYNVMDENGSVPLVQKENNNNGTVTYAIINWRSSWEGEDCVQDMDGNPNNSDTVASYCNDTGNNPNDLATCMECVYGKDTRVVCSRDNFAIRPEAFKLHIKDQNQSNPAQQSDVTTLSDSGSSGAVAPELHLAAGYQYNLEINATNHIDNSSTPGYTRSFNVDSTTLATYKWTPQSGHDVSGCNDPVDVNTSMRFLDGSVDVNTSLNNVGHYTLMLKDSSWTLVDNNPDFMTHHTGDYFLASTVADCKTNSNLVLNTGAVMSYNSSNNDDATLNGCDITSNHTNSEADIQYNDFNVTFHPYEFALAITASVGTDRSMPLALNSTSYIYYADITQATDENMSYHLDGLISAQGESGSTLSNFVDACYAVPVNINIITQNSRLLNDIDGNSVTYLARFHDLNTSAVVQNALDINATDSTPENPFVISTTAAHFLKDLQGNMSTQLNLNYQRTNNTAINPSEIKFVTYKAECGNPSTDCTFDANLTTITTQGTQDLNTTVRHYYGRTHNPRQSFAKTDTTVSYTDALDLIFYEVYCDGTDCNKSLLQDGTTSQFSDDPRWLINTNHTAPFGLPGSANQKGGSSYVTQTASASGNHPDAFGLRYDGTRGYPYKTTMENDASGWLIYNKYNATATTNSWDVEFTNANGNWAGVRETNTTTKRNATDLTNRRTLW